MRHLTSWLLVDGRHFLLNNTSIKHPGTKGVDLLFRYGHNQGQLNSVIKAFLSFGYISSAKHPFQIFRTAKVRGVDFVFNVDLLHSAPNQESYDLFADHLELSDENTVFYQYQSIVVPMSKILFESTCSVSTPIEAIMPNGAEAKIEINLMNELGTLITKVKSMKNEKRPRDSFDIMLAILQARDRNSLSKCIRDLNLGARLVSLMDITKYNNYLRNISKYYPKALEKSVWSRDATVLNSFFDESSIPTKA